MPCCFNQWYFSRKRVNRAGAASGLNNSKGCGSNTITTDGNFSSEARWRNCANTDRPTAALIRDLEQRGVAWKNFHEINFVNVHYKPFDAADWPLQPSGLLGPVRLVPATTEP